MNPKVDCAAWGWLKAGKLGRGLNKSGKSSYKKNQDLWKKTGSFTYG